MARNPYALANPQREARQQAYLSAPNLGDRFPKFREVGVELQFADPERKFTPSPQRRVFSPDMQAYFDVQCPLRGCLGGGFDLNESVLGALSNRRADRTGKRTCQGKRPRKGATDSRCRLELEFRVTTLEGTEAVA